MLIVACSSSETTSAPANDATADVVVDTSVADTTMEASVDSAPMLCDHKVSSTFDCEPPKKIATPSSACSDAQLQAMADACIADPLTTSPSGCGKWMADNAACAACVTDFANPTYPSHTIPQTEQCYWALFDDVCDTTVQCYFDCVTEACAACAITAGSGMTATSTAWSDCADRTRSSKGTCWMVAARDASDCFAMSDTTVCRVDELAQAKPDLAKLKTQIVQFYRGACRDGGDWTNRTTTKGDAGTDAAGD